MAELEKMAASSVNPLSAGISAASGAIGLVGQALQQSFARKEADKQREWSEAMQDKQNEWSLEQWNRTNEYNTPLEQRKRLEEAGLNPLYYGLDGSSANGLESAQALGYDRAALEQMKNPLQAGIESAQIGKQLELAQAQIEKTEAEKNQVEASTDETKLDIEFKQKTMEYRVAGEELANNLTKENIAKIQDERKQISENIKKIIAETSTEESRKLLVDAEHNLRKMEARQIAEMLPLQKMFVEAQTDAQRAQAAFAYAQAAEKNSLLEAGYVDSFMNKLEAEIRKVSSDADAAEAQATMLKFKSAIRSGNWSELMDELNGFQRGKFGKLIGREFDALFSVMSGLGEALAGPLSGVLK